MVLKLLLGGFLDRWLRIWRQNFKIQYGGSNIAVKFMIFFIKLLLFCFNLLRNGYKGVLRSLITNRNSESKNSKLRFIWKWFQLESSKNTLWQERCKNPFMKLSNEWIWDYVNSVKTSGIRLQYRIINCWV